MIFRSLSKFCPRDLRIPQLATQGALVCVIPLVAATKKVYESAHEMGPTELLFTVLVQGDIFETIFFLLEGGHN